MTVIDDIRTRFTPQAKQLLQSAGRVAHECGHGEIDSSHFLVALLRQYDSSTTTTLIRRGGLSEHFAYQIVSKADFAPNGGVVERFTGPAMRMFEVASLVSDRRGGKAYITLSDLAAGMFLSASPQIRAIMAQAEHSNADNLLALLLVTDETVAHVTSQLMQRG